MAAAAHWRYLRATTAAEVLAVADRQPRLVEVRTDCYVNARLHLSLIAAAHDAVDGVLTDRADPRVVLQARENR